MDAGKDTSEEMANNVLRAMCYEWYCRCKTSEEALKLREEAVKSYKDRLRAREQEFTRQRDLHQRVEQEMQEVEAVYTKQENAQETLTKQLEQALADKDDVEKAKLEKFKKRLKIEIAQNRHFN